MYMHMHVYIYIYIYIERERERLYIGIYTHMHMYTHSIVYHMIKALWVPSLMGTPNLPTSISPTNIARLKLSGKSPVGLGIPPPLNQDYA